jgi:catechol 2,3-dioxygenase-like lactoylglutathione lyase family enzyme
MEAIEFLGAVLLVSKDPERLVRFYRDVLGVPLEDEAHGDNLPHWGCTLGQLHFAIHPIEDFPDGRSAVGSVKLAFNTFDVHGLAKRLEADGVTLLYPPRDTGFFWVTAVEDPDGNLVELVEMSGAWYEYLEARRAQGHDVIARWRARGASQRM